MTSVFATLTCVVLLLVFGFLEYTVLGVKREFPTCRSGDTCKRLIDCVPYMNLIRSLRRPLSPPAVVFLRKQECGFDGMYPLVCCFTHDTRKPQGNRVSSLDDKTYPTHTSTSYVPNVHNINMDPEENHEGAYQHSRRPDLTPSDLSDYRLFKSTSKPLQKEFLVESSTPTTTTTEQAKTTTRLFRRKVNHNDYDYLSKVVAQTTRKPKNVEATRKRAEELKKKMEAINNAFMYSTLDYFFVRRMDNDQNKRNFSIQNINMKPEENHKETNQDSQRLDLTPYDSSEYGSFKLKDKDELKKKMAALNDALMDSTEDFVRRMDDRKDTNNVSTENISINPEEDDKETYQISKIPDLTTGDLSDYRSLKLKHKELKKKMKAINDALMYSSGDFVKRIDDEKDNKNVSIERPDLAPSDTEELKNKMDAIEDEFTYSVVDFVRRMDEGKYNNVS